MAVPTTLTQSSLLSLKPNSHFLSFNLKTKNLELGTKNLINLNSKTAKQSSFGLCLVVKQSAGDDNNDAAKATDDQIGPASRVEERLERKKWERKAYLVAAIMSSLGITSMAIIAVYYRFYWQMKDGQFEFLEMLCTFALSVGSAVGMEFWARWAHKELWHATLWHMHKSHHRPRDGPFEVNDVFVIINAVPAIALLCYGISHRGIFPGLCFGAGLGISLFGMAYMFVHDGLVHRRFPMGPIEDVPYLRKIIAAHQVHHSEKLNGVPYGLFLGPKELEEVGGTEELEKEIKRRAKVPKP